jgi:hypothetical protein
MQLGPAVEVLERIVRSVVCTPTNEALQVPTIVEILLIELTAGRNVLVEELALEARPSRRFHS